MGRRDVVLLAESLYGAEVQRTEYIAWQTVIHGVGEVRWHLNAAFYAAQTLLEERLCLEITRTTLCSLLVSHEIGITDDLCLYLLTVHQVAQLSEEQVERAAIDNEVMHVGKEKHILSATDNIHTIERTFL